MSGNWYCFLLDGQHLRGHSKEFITKEIRKIFDKDYCNVIILDNEHTDNFDSLSENYIFVCCKNYNNYINKIKQSDLISLVLPSTENPSVVSDDEVSKFIETTETIEEKRAIEVGSIVKVRDGHLKNLYGVIKRVFKTKDACEVFFRLYTKTFLKKIPKSNLTCVDSFFKYVKFPIHKSVKSKDLSKNIDSKLKKKIISKIKK